MGTTISNPDTWSEIAKVAIAAQGGADIAFGSITESVDIDIGDKDFDAIATIAGGRLVKFSPMDVTTITLEAYSLEAGTDTGTTGKGFFDLLNTVDASQPVSIALDKARNKYRMAILWCTDYTKAAEAQIVTPTDQALRVVAADGYFTSVKPSFTDGVLKFTVTYKVPPFDKSGVANVQIQSVAGTATATLATLASYTSTTKM
jgi:hypothetical protein